MSDDTRKASKIQKIKSLLALADDPRTPESEANLAREKATTIMIEWEIEDAVIRGDERVIDEQIVRRIFRLNHMSSTYGPQFATLVAAVVEGLGMRGFITQTYDEKYRKRDAAVIVGFESDMDRAEMIVNSILTQCVVALAEFGKNLWPNLSASQKYNERRSFIFAYGYTVGDRIAATRQRKVQETTTSTALVLVDRSAKVDTWVDDNMKVGRARNRRYTYDGSEAGRAAGARADIGQTATTGTTARALGR